MSDHRPEHGAAHEPERAPFFIVGSDRSGTTMLRLILDRAPNGPAVPPETMFITDFVPVWEQGGLEDHDAAVAFTKRVWSHPRVALWNLAGDVPLPPAGLTHAEAFRWGIQQPFLAYMRADGKTWWADKTPPYIDSVDALKAIFPDAKFIELVRDGRDVALSIIGLPFGDNNAYFAGRRWAHCIREGVRARANYPDDVLLVRYEELVTEPEREVRQISEFLGLEFDADMLAVEKTDASKLQSNTQGWFSNLWGGINQNAMFKWRTKMSATDQGLFLAAAQPEIELHGYEPGDVPAAAPTALQLRWMSFTNLLRRLGNFWKLRIVDERGRELRWVIARRFQ